MSEILDLSGAGWSPAACLDFDLGIEDFDLWLETRAEETVEKDAPPERKTRKVRVPKYRTLRDLLALRDEEAERIAPEVEAAAAAFLAGDLDLFDLPGLAEILDAPIGGGAPNDGDEDPGIPE